MNLIDLDFKQGSVNPSGIKESIFYIDKPNIQSWPTIEDDFDTAEDEDEYVQYDGNFTCKTGTHFHTIYSTQGKGKGDWEVTGETDCKMVLNKLLVKFPKITNASRAFAKRAVNGDFVFIFKHDGKWYVIGNKDYRVVVNPNGSTGDAAGSDKGLTIEIECPDTTPLPSFAGTIPVNHGTYDCATDTFTPSPTSGNSLEGN